MNYIKRFYISSFLHITLYSGFYLIYLQSLGLSKTQMGFLMSLSLILVALLEVPTGIVADKISKKASVLLSKILMVPSVLVLYLTHSFLDILIATLFGAFSVAFLTGAETGWIYELISREGKTEDYPKVYGRIRSLEMMGSFIGTLTGGFLADFVGMKLTILLTLPFVIASLLVLVTIPKDTVRSELSYHSHLLESLKFIKKSPEIAWLFLYANLIGASVIPFTSFMQLYFYKFLVSLTTVSSISAFHTLVNSISWYLDTDRYKGVLYRYAWIALPLLLFLAGFNRWLGFVTLTLGTFIFAQAFKEWQKKFQGIVPDEKRATLGSFYSLTAAITNGLLTAFLGWLFDHMGIMRGLAILALPFLVTGFLTIKYLAFTPSSS
ncbi:MFS transporter [Thermococcus sp.]|uniref:MFS transporter n=1 Tax=Thermococcus sp. TaxID=35749 RepID=UPI0025E09CE1|nr:MFS transporter [Thermococcus sp.]